MARRSLPQDPTIGERIRARRDLRGWSIRFAASRAGVAHTTWLRAEKGDVRIDRYLAADFAAALGCSTTDLTGAPHTPADRHLETAHARVPALWRAVVELAPDEPAVRGPVPAGVLVSRADLVDDLMRRSDYAGVAELAPELLADAHASARGPEAREALTVLVRATYAAGFCLRYLGFAGEFALAAERARQYAEQLGEPVALGVAEYLRGHAALAGGSLRRCATLAGRAVDELDRHHDQPHAAEIVGMLHLTTAAAILRERPDEAREHVAEAGRLADRTGETRIWAMGFGPTNVGIWRIGLEVDAGRPDEAARIAQDVNPAVLQWPSREAAYHIDRCRALTDLRQDTAAVRSLLTAERVAPQLVRSSVTARESTRFLLHRARRAAGGPELRGLAERLGVVA